MTANKNTESSQGDGGGGPPLPPPSGQTDQPESRNSNTVFKSGPLFISSKGIGWTSWKKRWFILTQTSLVFFRSDPSAVPQKGEVNLTLGGIDLNNSGSVVVKADKKLLTVLFPDGRDGRTFTLKAETTEDLYEWKTALENALAQAPNTAAVMGQNGILKNEPADGIDGSAEKSKEKPPAKSLIIGRPILLALEDVDGSPSFLEKALKFIEEHGIKVEGILRQAADVDDVERRIREYEQGKTEFIQGEDAHVIADCIKYFLRELPSSPVPASCCNALLEACRTDRSKRVSSMRTAICETFPEPNRRLLQRILVMMQTVASHKTVNRMSTSAVAACMAPLLLRPLLAGDCEIETNIDVGGDSSIQLLKAAAAANHAQAILITLLEEYGTIFSEGSMSPGLYTDSEECESEEEEVTDDDEYYEDDEEDDATEEGDAYTDDDLDELLTGSYTGSDGSGEDNLSFNKDGDGLSSGSKSSEVNDDSRAEPNSSSSVQTTLLPNDDGKRSLKITDRSKSANAYGQLLEDESMETTLESKQTSRNAPECIQKSATIANGPAESMKRPTIWGRTSARKNLSMESIDFPIEEEAELEHLEAAKLELQNQISEEVKSNAALQANLQRRRKAFEERRLALEQEVARLQEQLQVERNKRKALESALSSTEKPLSVPTTIDEKMKADIEEVHQTEADITKLKEQVDDLSLQLNQQRGSTNCFMSDSITQSIHTTNDQAKVKDKQKDVGGKSGNKDNSKYGAESKNEYETPLSNKHPHNQQQGQTRRSSSSKSASTHSKKSNAKNEVASLGDHNHSENDAGANSTSSAITRLTTKLNFLKERRNQLANELHNLDKTRASTQAVLNQERGRGSEDSQSAQNSEKGSGIEGQSFPNSNKSRKSENHTLQSQDDSEGQDPRILERGKSEGHVSYIAGSGDKPHATPRTNTR